MAVSVKNRIPRAFSSTKKEGSVMSKKKTALLESLVYEVIDGNPVYYRGYEQVIAGKIPKEAIMGSSILQSLFISKLLAKLFQFFPENKYMIGTNELGILYEKGSWVSTDIAIIRNAMLEGYKIDNHYFNLPPALVIEVDTKASFDNFDGEETYYQIKTKRYLDFGVEKVIWIYTQSKMVMIAEKGKDWILGDWERTITLVDDQSLDLGAIIKSINL
jgi:hypothetical protein